MSGVADELAEWAVRLRPTGADLELAQRSLVDTVAVTLAARDHPLRRVVGSLPDAARWAAVGHVLDFDDLHLPSTAHISVVCVPTVLASGGDARCYLAGAGVMARLGAALGWRHYAGGWHATCTAGALAAAVAAGLSRGLDQAGLAQAMALAVPAAGGVQRAFGTDAKSLQVGFAAQAGVRAAALVAAGARADPRAVDQWLGLVGADTSTSAHSTPTHPTPARSTPMPDRPAVPDGLAIKLFACCYALQRPIAAVREVLPVDAERVERVLVRTPASTRQPLVHKHPRTGLEGKFSLEYAVAATLLDEFPGLASFTDAAVRRASAQALLRRVEVAPCDDADDHARDHADDGVGDGDGLLSGELELTVQLSDGLSRTATVREPPGSPHRPATAREVEAKLASCGADGLLDGLTWARARELLTTELPRKGSHDA